jgi:spermidine synthase
MKNNKWFSEKSVLWQGRALSLEYKSILYSAKSKYQMGDVYDTVACGKMLVLDGVIQLTESDEFTYQEMMTHVPLMTHENPENILIIGGGDGGIAREAFRHKSVKNVELVDIDEDVIFVSKQFFPTVSVELSNPKLEIIIDDGAKYLESKNSEYDVIITDSSDPVGPAETLFRKDFYEKIKNALKPNGIAISQAESYFLHQEIISSLVKNAKTLFPSVGYGFVQVPTYPSGMIGFLVCSNSERDVARPASNKLSLPMLDDLKYYTIDIHNACFQLPNFARKFIEIS